MWFARRRRHRAYARLAEMTARLQAAEAEQHARVATDPEHQAAIAKLRADVANLYAETRRSHYP